jgi:hypothetical protein
LARVQRGGITGGVTAEVGHGAAQGPGQGVEALAEGGQMRLLAERVGEPRQVPAVGDLVLGGDVDEPAQRGIAMQFLQAGVEGGVPKEDRQEHDAPESGDGIVVAAVSAGGD